MPTQAVVGYFTPKGTDKKFLTITLDPDSAKPVSFGLRKARLIVEHLEAIKKFVADNPQTKDEE